MKKICALVLAIMFVFAMVGCTPASKQPNPTPVTPVATPADTDVMTAAKPSVAVVIAGGLGDRSFYDSANAGLEKLKAEYDLETKVIECQNDASMYQSQLTNAAETCNIVVAVGWEFHDALKVVAPAMPDVKFIYVDEAIEGLANVYNITYAQNEGSFLVGYIAAKMSKTGKVGAVGGMDNDTINDFILGYKQGAKYANKEIKVKTMYANTFEDPAKGKECALSLYDNGCDIVFQIAGKTGEGVFEAAKDKKAFAIGVDCDQKYINPDVIICSMIKNVGDSVYDAIAQFIKDGTFAGGTRGVMGLDKGFISVGYGEEGATQQVSDELKDEIKTIIAKIASGEIVVDTTRQGNS